MWDQHAIDHYRHQVYDRKRINARYYIESLNSSIVGVDSSKFTKKIRKDVLLPFRDLPPPSDPYWKSLRGWENKETVKEFTKYVAKVVEELGDVDYWVTICEAVSAVIGAGYIAGLWPPGFFLDGNRAKNAFPTLPRFHIK